MIWTFNDERPIYSQLVEQFTARIVSGEFLPGQRLDSVRDLAQTARVNPNTMQKAMAELERNGLVFSQRTAGRFITEDVNMINNIKETLATEQIKIFLEKMNSLGLTSEQVVALIAKADAKSIA